MNKITMEHDTQSYTQYIAGTVNVNTEYDFSIIVNYDSNTDYTETAVNWINKKPYSSGTIELKNLKKKY